MNEKSEQKKQLIILSIILIFVIILAVLLNAKNKEDSNIHIQNTNNNIVQNEETKEQNILDNLKGLLEEPDPNEEEYIQEEIEGNETKQITTNNGETVIIKE